VNAFQAGYGGKLDAFVARLNATGSALVYASYFGGGSGGGTAGGDEVGNGIALDAAGNAYATGYTGSTDFPTVNAWQATLQGGGDAFVAKINASGTALVYSTYLGGGSVDVGNGIAVDLAGNAYVAGFTASSDFPTVNAFQADFGGNLDAFVAKLNPTGFALVYSTYIGGGSTEVGNGVAVNAAGNAYVSGSTASTDFPTVNALQSVLGGHEDAFVAKLNFTWSALVYSTYIGGSSSDGANGIAVDLAGNAYVTGVSYSTDFPTTPGPFGTVPNGGGDAFVAKLNSTGSAYVYATYLGGSSLDYGNHVAVDSAGNAYVIGQTMSADFPTTDASVQTTTASGALAFVAKVTDLAFAGLPGEPNCQGKSVSALARQYRGLYAAAMELGFPRVQALQDAVRRFCGQ
jgi:hypothetical protein